MVDTKNANEMLFRNKKTRKEVAKSFMPPVFNGFDVSTKVKSNNFGEL